MNLNQIQNIYFIGIGGIGMSALAKYFKNTQKNVVGYDKTPTLITTELIDDGISIHFEDEIKEIPQSFLQENTLVIITPAVPKSHKELNYFIEKKYNIKKRAEVLGIITKDTFCFAVAGTHGKTTTSAILGHILYQSGVEVTAFVGGIVENYNSNLIGNGKKVSVVEADEFDRSFLQLYPNIACITSIDADHLDIYGTSEAIENTFLEFANKIQDKTKLFLSSEIPFEGVFCAVNKEAEFKAFNYRIENEVSFFDVETPSGIYKDFQLNFPGKHNLTNAVMALAMAFSYGVSIENIGKALKSFRGIKRRFSFQIKTKERVLIDDYAHHPTEINALREAIRELYPTEKITIIFQPHLYSRTIDFADGFAESLTAFDEIILLDIYPARELPIDGVTSDWLLSKITNQKKKLVAKEKLISEVLKTSSRVIAVVGAGDIGELVIDIKKALDENI